LYFREKFYVFEQITLMTQEK